MVTNDRGMGGMGIRVRTTFRFEYLSSDLKVLGVELGLVIVLE